MPNALKQIFLIGFFFIQHLFGQNPYYHTINKTNGLPHNFVYDIYQDKNKMMWMATNEGLCSYDGYQFTTFYNEQQSSKSGSNIIEDRFGRVWYCNFDGNIYYVAKGKLNVLEIKNPIGFHKFNIINNFLIYLQKNELVFLDLKSLLRVAVVPFDTNKIIGIQKIKNTLYIVGKSIFEIQSPTSIKKYHCGDKFNKTFNGGLITYSSNQLIFISKYSNDYCLFHKGKFEYRKYDNSLNFLQNASADNSHNWLASTKGLLRVNFSKSYLKTEKFFEEFNVSSIYKDKDNGYWVTTLGDGVLYIPNFKNILYPTLGSPTVLEDVNDILYYGTNNDKLVKIGQLENLNSHQIIYNGQSNHSVVNLTYAAANNQFLYTSNTFKAIDVKGKIQKEDIFAVKQLEPIDKNFFAYASSGNFGLIKLNNYPSVWDDIHQKHKKLNVLEMNFSSFISGIRGKSVAFDSISKTIYFATNIGLFEFQNDILKEIKVEKKSLYLLKIHHFKGIVYGLTTNNDLIAVNPKTKQVKTIYNSQLEGDVLQKTKLINTTLYLTTSSKCLAYNLVQKSFKNIFNINPDVEINDVLLKDNTLILATSKGIISLDNSAFPKEKKSKFLLQGILVNNKTIQPKLLSDLAYSENNIEIQFSVIAYPQNANEPIFYAINQEKWQKISGNNRSLLLNSLSPGQYTIAFKTDLNDANPVEISFRIKKPIWEKWWFIVIIISMIIFGIGLFYRRRIQTIQSRNIIALEKASLENNLTQSKIKAIKSQMNPHFFYNALNTLQSYILSNDKKQALEYLSKFSGLTRTILEMTEKDTITIGEEINTLRLYLEIEKARFENDFEFEITINPEIDKEQTKIPSMLLQPFVENAVKHGLLHKKDNKKVIIRFEMIADCLEITIDDNGIGRKKSAELNQIKNKNHQSFATAAIQNRIDLLNRNNPRKIAVTYEDKIGENAQPKGTLVKITIPKND